MKLSIIIPIYNVENYLNRCLDSCLIQDIPSDKYEVIAVNDGSPDNCAKILADYSKIHNNLRILTQHNSGLSIARNNGLKIAKGEYVWFVDSDDWIENNCLLNIFRNLEKKPDILQLPHQLVFEDGSIKEMVINKVMQKGLISGEMAIKEGGLPSPAQFSIYNRNFLSKHNLMFFPGILHEDSEFKPRVTFFAESILWHDQIVYNYFQRSSGSITSSFTIRNALDLIEVDNRLIKFSYENIKKFKLRYHFHQFIGLNFNTILYESTHFSEESKNTLIRTICKNNQIFKNMIFSNKFKYQVEGLFFLLMPKLSFRLYQVIAR